jgi:hypothetical protein
VLCLQKSEETKKTAENIKIDLGGEPRDPVQIWGLEQLGQGVDAKRKLTYSFRQYLDNLGWR